MSLEIGKTDEANGVSDIIKMSNQIEEENQVLIEELTSSTKQVQELERALKVLSKKNKALEEAASLLESEAIQLEEEVEQLKEQATLPFKTSEKAMIIADEMENTPVKKVSKVNNQFLTEGVMALMPKLNN
jgi:predicted nuclease with TOPRIM domain